MPKVDDCIVKPAMPDDVVIANSERNSRLGYREIHTLEEWREEMPLAIVGGGPSLRDTVNDLRRFERVMVCGSPHDWIVAQGITPKYTVLCDPDPVMANYIRNPVEGCRYLVASQCDEAVFQALRGKDIVLWHCGGNLAMKHWQTRQMVAVGGGCTVLTRSMVIAMCLGYRDFQLFGCDNCVGEEHHAYEVNEPIGPVVSIRLGGEHGREFLMAEYMLAQLFDFKKLLGQYAHRFRVTVHGGGALAELMRLGEMQARAA